MTYLLSEWLNLCTFPPSLSLTVSLIVNKSWITQLCTRRAVNREHRSPKRRGNAVLLTNCALFDYIISGVEWNKRWKVECSGIWENKRHGGEGGAQHDQSQSQVAAEIVVQVHRQFFVELIIKNMWKGYRLYCPLTFSSISREEDINTDPNCNSIKRLPVAESDRTLMRYARRFLELGTKRMYKKIWWSIRYKGARTHHSSQPLGR